MNELSASFEEQKLYAHLLGCVKSESPSELLERFRHLFIEGNKYQDKKACLALEKIIKSKQAKQEFKFVLNRCCHILINCWQMQPQLRSSIPELVALFEHLSPPESACSRNSRRLRQLVKDFTETDQYLALKRLAKVISQNTEANRSRSESVGNLINRYPYLYEHCLLSEDNSYEAQQTVRQIQERIQHRFELDLSRYVTCQVRLVKIARARQWSTEAGPIIEQVKNPTLLSERELEAALTHFVGTVERGHTYRDLSQSFLVHSVGTNSYQAFKDDLYEYLISSIDSKYGKYQFNEKLYKYLQNLLPHCNSHKPSEFLILRTYSHLLNFLVVESPQRANHYVFVDLITNLGPALTVGLLLKVVLACRKIKPYLEKRFSILFSHYESFAKDGVPWLVKSLENLHIALSVHFGSLDLSCLKQIM